MNVPTGTAPLAPPLHFDAVLTPHRSLSRKGFVIMMTLVAVVSFIAGVAFLLMGAWPVFGFFGLDVALIYGAFKLNYRAGRVHETVQLSDGELKVRRVAPNGATRAWSFQPYWVRVVTEEQRADDVGLYLVSHGRRLRIGAFLAPEERRDFADALRRALEAARTGVRNHGVA